MDAEIGWFRLNTTFAVHDEEHTPGTIGGGLDAMARAVRQYCRETGQVPMTTAGSFLDGIWRFTCTSPGASERSYAQVYLAEPGAPKLRVGEKVEVYVTLLGGEDILTELPRGIEALAVAYRRFVHERGCAPSLLSATRGALVWFVTDQDQRCYPVEPPALAA